MKISLRYWYCPVLLGGALLWAYWPIVRELVDRWIEDPQYSHGFLVPLFAAFLLWTRREMVRDVRFAPNWWGLALLALGMGMWAAGTLFFLGAVGAISLLPALAGLAVICAGWPAL